MSSVTREAKARDPLSSRRALLWGVGFYLCFLPLVGLVPYWVSVDPTSASAASLLGYNNTVAHILVGLWSVVCVVALALGQRKGVFDSALRSERRASSLEAVGTQRHSGIELLLMFAVTVFLFFPTFLAKHGPYVEDSYFLTVLHRMHGGQRPYRDFETLYGPLMLYAAHFWTRLAGYSMASYYSYLALLEAVQYTALLAIIQRYYSEFRQRVGAFVLLSAFLFNTLLGVTWNGLRRLAPVLIILYVSRDPRSTRTTVTAGIATGLLLSYSHDFGILCLVAIGGIYALPVLRARGFDSVKPALVLGTSSIMSWLVCTGVLLRSDFPFYLRAGMRGMSRFAVEASFPFYWTLNSLATFAFLTLVLVVVGRGLGRDPNTPIEAGDRLLFGGAIYALMAMKSGLNRADMWHLAIPMLVLILAFLLPMPMSLFSFSRRAHRLGIALIVVMAVTYFAALLPTGSYYFAGWSEGLRDTLAENSPPSPHVISRAPTVEVERTNPSRDVLGVGEYLAQSQRRHRPVVLYSGLWGFDKRFGVYKTIYPTDDFLLSDEDGIDVRDYLERNPDVLVVIDAHTRQQLLNADPTRETEFAPVYPKSITKSILGWLSTTHYLGGELEAQQKERRWQRTVGNYLVSEYEEEARFGRFVVLSRASER